MTINKIVKKVSTEFGLDITKRSRKREYVYARAVYYKIARDMYNKTLSEIGRSVGVDRNGSAFYQERVSCDRAFRARYCGLL